MATETVNVQVEGLLWDQRARVISGACRPSVNDGTVTDWLRWLAHTRGRAPVTVYNYASIAVRFLEGCAVDRDLDAVPIGDIERWLLRPRRNGDTGKPATRAREVAVLQSLYRWAYRNGRSQRDVGQDLHAPTVHNTRPKALPDAVWDRLWQSRTLTDRDRLMFGCGFFLGLRRQEIVTIKAGHFDSERAELVGFGRKGGGQGRLPVGELVEVWTDLAPQYEPERFFPLLAARLDGLPRDGTVVPMGLDYVNQRVKRCQHAARVPEQDRFTPHALRHSFVTNLLRLSMPIELVSELAGHSSLDVTMRYVTGGGARVAEWRSGVTAKIRLADWR